MHKYKVSKDKQTRYFAQMREKAENGKWKPLFIANGWFLPVFMLLAAIYCSYKHFSGDHLLPMWVIVWAWVCIVGIGKIFLHFLVSHIASQEQLSIFDESIEVSNTGIVWKHRNMQAGLSRHHLFSCYMDFANISKVEFDSETWKVHIHGQFTMEETTGERVVKKVDLTAVEIMNYFKIDLPSFFMSKGIETTQK